MTETATVGSITKSVHVACSQERAFEVFTRELDTWWPLESHATAPGNVREVVWEEREGGEVYEVSHDGERAHWATVLVWEPPARLLLAWHVNPSAAAPTDVEVSFTPEGAGTQVTLEHRHWERLGDVAAAQRGNYDDGWNVVLERLVRWLA